MPYKAFESGGYEWSKGFLFDESDIIWSGGIFPNTALDAWANKLEKLDTREKIEQLILEGYTGVWMSRDIFQTYGRMEEYKSLVLELTDILDEQPIYSKNNKFVYFDMRKYIGQYSTSSTDKKMVYPIYSEDFYSEEKIGENIFRRWCKKCGSINIFNSNDENMLIRVRMKVKSIADSDILIYKNEQILVEINVEENQEEEVKFELECSPGDNIITIVNSIEPVPSPIGIKEVSFCILNDTYLNITE